MEDTPSRTKEQTTTSTTTWQSTQREPIHVDAAWKGTPVSLEPRRTHRAADRAHRYLVDLPAAADAAHGAMADAARIVVTSADKAPAEAAHAMAPILRAVRTILQQQDADGRFSGNALVDAIRSTTGTTRSDAAVIAQSLMDHEAVRVRAGPSAAPTSTASRRPTTRSTCSTQASRPASGARRPSSPSLPRATARRAAATTAVTSRAARTAATYVSPRARHARTHHKGNG